jgi:hypothetical protein
MTCDIAKSQEYVAFLMSCRFSIKSELEIWQHRNRAHSPLSWHYKPLFRTVVFESHSTSQAVIELSSPGNMVSRNTVQLQLLIV